MNEEIKLQDYGYTTNQKLEVDAQMILSFLNFFSAIVQKEKQEVLLFDLPKIEKNKIEYKSVGSLLDFLSQPPQVALTMLGAKALNYQMALEEVHRKAIDLGIAIKNTEVGEFKVETDV